MKTLADLYDNAELCGYYPQCNCWGIGFIELISDDDFSYRTDDYFVICSVGDKKAYYRHCKVHYTTGNRAYVRYRGLKIYLDEVMKM